MNISIIFEGKEKPHYYEFTFFNDSNKIYLNNNEGAGIQFDAIEITNVIYEALDKFFKEHY